MTVIRLYIGGHQIVYWPSSDCILTVIRLYTDSHQTILTVIRLYTES